jgi:CRP-like cAMP-binding protein
VVAVDVEADRPAHPAVLAHEGDVQQIQGALRAVELLADLSLTQLTRVLNACRVVDLPAGDVLIEAEEICSSMVIVVQGVLVVTYADGSEVLMGPGRQAGEDTLIHPRWSRAAVRADEPTRVLVLDREPFSQLLRARPWLGVILLERLGSQLSRSLEWALATGRAGDEGADTSPGSSMVSLLW